jgi:hypothetical protein
MRCCTNEGASTCSHNRGNAAESPFALPQIRNIRSHLDNETAPSGQQCDNQSPANIIHGIVLGSATINGHIGGEQSSHHDILRTRIAGLEKTLA